MKTALLFLLLCLSGLPASACTFADGMKTKIVEVLESNGVSKDRLQVGTSTTVPQENTGSQQYQITITGQYL